ncbi:MAG: response regulator [Dehalococcoidia bacterium]
MAERILVIDDDSSILALVCSLLRDVGYDVTGVSDATEGLRLIQSARPDLIVLDMRMPKMDGWQFSSQLVERGIDIPVVVMTAAQDARRWAQEINAIGYVEKPFDIDRLLDEVQRVLGREQPGTSFFSLRVRGLPGLLARRAHALRRPATPRPI